MANRTPHPDSWQDGRPRVAGGLANWRGAYKQLDDALSLLYEGPAGRYCNLWVAAFQSHLSAASAMPPRRHDHRPSGWGGGGGRYILYVRLGR